MKQLEAEREKIPTNDEIIAAIPSKAVREYLRKIGHKFSERDLALLYRAIVMGEEFEFKELGEKDDYVSVPFPFRSGDIVTLVGGQNCDVGVFASCKDDESWRRWDEYLRTKLAGFVDFSDTARTRVDFLRPDGTFWHDHPSALYLEYAEFSDDDPRKDALEIASELLRGTESSLEDFQRLCKEYSDRNTDVAEDIITARCERLDATFVWSEETVRRFNELNEFLSKKQHEIYEAVRAEAQRICALGSLPTGWDAADGYEITGELVLSPDYAECEKRLSLETGVLLRMVERTKELYSADWDSRYDDLADFDDEKKYDRKALLRCEAITICGKEFAVCDSLKALHRSRAFSVQDLLALPKSAFTLQLNTKRVFGAVIAARDFCV